jgi:hypothetical protein
VAPPACHSACRARGRVVADRRRHRHPEQHAEREQQPGAGRGGLPGEVHGDQAGEGGDEPDEGPAVGRIPGQVGAEREEPGVAAMYPIVCPNRVWVSLADPVALKFSESILMTFRGLGRVLSAPPVSAPRPTIAGYPAIDGGYGGPAARSRQC